MAQKKKQAKEAIKGKGTARETRTTNRSISPEKEPVAEPTHFIVRGTVKDSKVLEGFGVRFWGQVFLLEFGNLDGRRKQSLIFEFDQWLRQINNISFESYRGEHYDTIIFHHTKHCQRP